MASTNSGVVRSLSLPLATTWRKPTPAAAQRTTRLLPKPPLCITTDTGPGCNTGGRARLPNAA